MWTYVVLLFSLIISSLIKSSIQAYPVLAYYISYPLQALGLEKIEPSPYINVLGCWHTDLEVESTPRNYYSICFVYVRKRNFNIWFINYKYFDLVNMNMIFIFLANQHFLNYCHI